MTAKTHKQSVETFINAGDEVVMKVQKGAEDYIMVRGHYTIYWRLSICRLLRESLISDMIHIIVLRTCAYFF